VRRHVKYESAAGGGACERCGVAEVASDDFDIEVLHAATRSDERAHAVSSFGESARDVPSEEAGGAGDEGGFHDWRPARSKTRGKPLTLQRQLSPLVRSLTVAVP